MFLFSTVRVYFWSGMLAGPRVALPVEVSKVAPCLLQIMLVPLILPIGKPSCVQAGLKALNTPDLG